MINSGSGVAGGNMYYYDDGARVRGNISTNPQIVRSHRRPSLWWDGPFLYAVFPHLAWRCCILCERPARLQWQIYLFHESRQTRKDIAQRTKDLDALDGIQSTRTYQKFDIITTIAGIVRVIFPSSIIHADM
jgi:hypothetical protein